MEFHIENTKVYGVPESIMASGNPMRTKIVDRSVEVKDSDFKRAVLLGNTGSGEGHDQFLTGCIVQFDLYAPLFQWKEIQRYHFLDFVSSQSTMHRLAKFDIASQCVSDVDPYILSRYQELLNNYNSEIAEGNKKPEEDKQAWRRLVASLPSGFVLGATMTTNYRQLKTIYFQRKNHKLKEWHDFCAWCETLPMFKELCLNENN